MTEEAENYILEILEELQDKVKDIPIEQLIRETHENNIMLRQIIQYINMTIKNSQNEEMQDFMRNVLADMFCSRFK